MCRVVHSEKYQQHLTVNNNLYMNESAQANQTKHRMLSLSWAQCHKLSRYTGVGVMLCDVLAQSSNMAAT